jgi:hypothetical protein
MPVRFVWTLRPVLFPAQALLTFLLLKNLTWLSTAVVTQSLSKLPVKQV